MGRFWERLRGSEAGGTEDVARNIGGTLLRHVPPEYDRETTLEENWQRYYEWALELPQPAVQIVEHGLEVRRHPIGFTAVYLTERLYGMGTPWGRGIIRANIIEPRKGREPLRDDIHSHGYWFVSGLVDGEVTNNRYPGIFPFEQAEDGDPDAYVGYETRPSEVGVNKVMLMIQPSLIPKAEPHELKIGEGYTMQPFDEIDAPDEFHSLASDGGITIFGKTPAGVARMLDRSNRSIIFRSVGAPPPPPEY